MTSLNKLFIRYFIITVAFVLVLATIVSNFGAFIFFRQFVLADNIEKNEGIVEIVEDMVTDENI